MKQQSKNILWVLIAIAVLLVGIKLLSSTPSSTASDSGPVEDAKLTISETNWNFGDISMSEGITTKEISLTNNSSSPITITRMETSCMCTTTQIVHADGSKSGLKGMAGHGGSPTLSETVEVGETVTLRVNFDPNAHGPNATGPITRNVMMKTNSLEQSDIKFTFSGNVVK